MSATRQVTKLWGLPLAPTYPIKEPQLPAQGYGDIRVLLVNEAYLFGIWRKQYGDPASLPREYDRTGYWLRGNCAPRPNRAEVQFS